MNKLRLESYLVKRLEPLAAVWEPYDAIPDGDQFTLSDRLREAVDDLYIPIVNAVEDRI